MISPVLEEGKTTVDVYFPDDVWYDYYTVSHFLSIWYLLYTVPHVHMPKRTR